MSGPVILAVDAHGAAPEVIAEAVALAQARHVRLELVVAAPRYRSAHLAMAYAVGPVPGGDPEKEAAEIAAEVLADVPDDLPITYTVRLSELRPTVRRLRATAPEATVVPGVAVRRRSWLGAW